MNLSQRFQYFLYDLIFDYFLLTLFLDREIRNSSDNITEYFFLLLMVKQVKKNLKEAFLRQMRQDLRILGQVADQFDHESSQFVSFFFVDGI